MRLKEDSGTWLGWIGFFLKLAFWQTRPSEGDWHTLKTPSGFFSIQNCKLLRYSWWLIIRLYIVLKQCTSVFPAGLIRVTEVMYFTHGCCLLCLPGDIVQVRLQEQALWYFPHLCPDWLSPISVPVTGSFLSLSSLFKGPKKKKKHLVRLKLNSHKTVNNYLLSLLTETFPRVEAEVTVCVLQRTWVQFCSPPIVCCGCSFVACSAVVAINLKTCWTERRSNILDSKTRIKRW